MPIEIAREPRLFAVLVRIIVLLASFEQPVMPGGVVRADFLFVVAPPRAATKRGGLIRNLRLSCARFFPLSARGVVERSLLAAVVVLVFSHRFVSSVDLLLRATGVPKK